MLADWLFHALRLARQEADFYSGARKILRPCYVEFGAPKPDLRLEDAGYSKQKLSMLKRLYFHEESHAVAIELWKRRRHQGKYGSVSFTTFNHFIKNDPENKSKRASVMGPCIQSVSLTQLPSGKIGVDAFYRTTEFFKKFPADLVFIRDTLLPSFEGEIESIGFHFANVTMHPMYYVTIIPLLKNPIRHLKELAKEDKYFHDWVVKWTARYVCDEHHRGIAKFAQAMRVCMDARKRIPADIMKPLQEYLRDVHPGYRNEYEDDDADTD